jgi:hypothetical protein
LERLKSNRNTHAADKNKQKILAGKLILTYSPKWVTHCQSQEKEYNNSFLKLKHDAVFLMSKNEP